MAFFRIRGNSITLLHGERDDDMGVRHRRLLTFKGLDDLRARLAPDRWRQLQLRIEQDHPDLVLDWEALRTRAEQLTSQGQTPPSPEEKKRKLRKCIRHLLSNLPFGNRPEDRHLARVLGPDLRELLWRAGALYGSLTGDPMATWQHMQIMFPASEATEELVDRGRYCFRIGQPARARKQFEQARRLDPCDPDIDNSEGVGWLGRGKLAEAERLFRQARELAFEQLSNPERSYSWSQLEVRPYLRATSNLALVKERQGKLEEALALYEECLQRCPNDGIGARFHLGPLHQRMGNLLRSVEVNAEHCHGNLMDPPDPFYDMASALFQLGRRAEALDRLLQGIAVNRHIPPLLLGKKSKEDIPDHAAVDSPEWARGYASGQRDLWPRECLAFLKQVWANPELQERLRRLEQLERELEQSDRGPRRAEALARLGAFRGELFPEQLRAMFARTFEKSE